MISETNNRILVIDDNPAIHEDFRKILVAGQLRDKATDDLLSVVLGKREHRAAPVSFELESVLQGREGLAKVEAALREGKPYALAFVDIRMPPGWDGVETITHLWSKDPALQVVICTAYSDYSWQEIVEKLGNSDRLVILKKPFDNIEVLQLAHAMTKKWTVTRQASAKFEDLDRVVRSRTNELEKLNRELANQISEREQVQAALSLSEERLRSAFDACPFPIAILHVSDQGVVQANTALLAATERDGCEIVGQPFWSLGFEAAEEFRRTATGRLVRGEALRRHECVFLNKSGERRRGLLWLEPFTLAAGPHVIAILQDVTEQTVLETQVRQAQKMEAVGHLAAGIAHDFNNLLTVIQGHTSIRLRSANLDRKVADSLAAVQQAAEKAADLTRQLLAFSRKQLMEKGTLCLAGVVSNIAAMLTRLIPESIRLHFSHADGRPSICGDRCNVEQVVLNLVVNARDAMPRGGDISISTELVQIDAAHVRCSTEARVGSFVCLTVRDTGVGMEETVLRRVFEPFFTTKETGKGTGMGLATVHGIVKQHDGWIEVESTPGVGTVFRVYFPLSAPERETGMAPDGMPPSFLRGNTVLLVEDDASVRSMARTVLEEAGVRVFEAQDGPAALSLWKDRRGEVDLMVTDMVMPGGLSGTDLADRVRMDRPDLPVVFSSGYSITLFDEDRRFRQDVNYLAKPYVAGELLRIVSAALGNRGASSVREPSVA